MTLNPADIAYFHRRSAETPVFWSRFGGRPSLHGAKVLDVGCGFGNLCIDMAQAGASTVVGIDINPEAITFAQQNLQENYADWTEVITFLHQNLEEYDGNNFDIVVSKDSFEHIIDLPGMLAAMKERLKPGGRIYTGFGPLYNSPKGDHNMVRIPLPWAHVLIGRKRTVRRVDKRWKYIEVRTLADMGLNGYDFADYVQVFQNSGMNIIQFEPNASDKSISKLFTTLRRIPFLTELLTHNIYCVLEKPA